MVIGIARVYLAIGGARSLKDKRMVVKSLIDRVRHKFNVSIAEVGDNDALRSAVLGFACVSNEKRHAEAMTRSALNFIEAVSEAEIVNIETEFY